MQQLHRVVSTLHDDCKVVAEIVKLQVNVKVSGRVVRTKLNLYTNRI